MRGRVVQPFKIAIAAAGLALIASGAGYAYWASREHTPLLAWQDASIVARGKVLYSEQCASCHGAKGEGQAAAGIAAGPGPLAPPHDGTGHTSEHPDFALIQLTKSGEAGVTCLPLDENAMPKFEEALTDRQVLDVLSYIKSTWPEEVVAQQAKVNLLYQSHNEAMWSLLDLTRPD
ncbi:MAG: cytochrome c [Rhizobiaceae bacterium]